MSPQAAVRAQARQALKDQWPTAVIAFGVLLIPLYLIDGMCTAIICTIITLFTEEAVQNILSNLVIYPLMLAGGYLLSPLFNGYIRLFCRNMENGRMDIRDLTYFFYEGRYGRTLGFNLSFALRMIIPTALFFSPVAAYEAVCRQLGSFADSVLYLDFHFILCVLSVLLVMLYSLKYFFAFVIYDGGQELSNSEIFQLSKRINRVHSSSAVKLLFSYTPWFLLCMTILPILYVGPYLTQGMCIGAEWMRSAYHESEALALRSQRGYL